MRLAHGSILLPVASNTATVQIYALGSSGPECSC